jgi:hypothetical protein
MNAPTLPAAWSDCRSERGWGPLPNPTGNRRFADRWDSLYPGAVACLRADLDDLLTCFRYPTLEARKAVPTTNAIE